MKKVVGIVCFLLSAATLGLLALWLGRIYYFAGSVSGTFAQLKMLGTDAIAYGGILTAVTVVFLWLYAFGGHQLIPQQRP